MNVFDDRMLNGNFTDPDILRSEFETRYPNMKEWRGTPAYDFAADCWLDDNGYGDIEPWEHEAGQR